MEVDDREVARRNVIVAVIAIVGKRLEIESLR